MWIARPERSREPHKIGHQFPQASLKVSRRWALLGVEIFTKSTNSASGIRSSLSVRNSPSKFVENSFAMSALAAKTL
jgi:hypothetical protein